MALNSDVPYLLPYPVDSDVADVPQDIKNLAIQLVTALNRKLERADYAPTPGAALTQGADKIYQRKIQVLAVLPNSGVNEGDVVFLVP